MSGTSKGPSNEVHTIALLARAVWDSTGPKFSFSTHYLEIHLPRNSIAVFEKTELASMQDEYIEKRSAEAGHLFVLIITSEESDGANFMAMSLPMDEKGGN